MSTKFLFDFGGVEQPMKVRRCLFGKLGKSDRDALKKQEEIQDETDAERFRNKWGFDPVKGFAVDGAEYICSPVDIRTEFIPEFYTKGYASRKSKPVVRARESWRGPYNEYVFADAQQVSSRRSVKRRIQLDFDDDQENKVHVIDSDIIKNPLRVPSPQPPVTTSISLTVSPRPPCQPVGVTCSMPDPSIYRKTESSNFSSPSLSTLQRTVSSVVLSDRKSVAPSSKKRCRISPSPFLDLATPRSIDTQLRTPRQTLMKDFFPIQKKRSPSHFEI